jgi:hypothetical protein
MDLVGIQNTILIRLHCNNERHGTRRKLDRKALAAGTQATSTNCAMPTIGACQDTPERLSSSNKHAALQEILLAGEHTQLLYHMFYPVSDHPICTAKRHSVQTPTVDTTIAQNCTPHCISRTETSSEKYSEAAPYVSVYTIRLTRNTNLHLYRRSISLGKIQPWSMALSSCKL